MSIHTDGLRSISATQAFRPIEAACWLSNRMSHSTVKSASRSPACRVPPLHFVRWALVALVPNLWRTGLPGILGIEDRGEQVPFDLDEFRGHVGVGGSDSSDVVADEPCRAVQDLAPVVEPGVLPHS